MSLYTDSSKVFKSRYENFIGGKWVAPVDGQYTTNKSPINGQALCEVPASSAADIEKALDSATKAKESWGNTSVAQRASILLKIADRIEENLEKIA
ncbi:MAG: aldehyde dehydrogenase family protein, partial [Helicobacter sp.]|nr:aldehyde dehydrogenase family protein [Helicobacter sp.]